ncbi:spermidine/putrescine ABC transporter ATP-binding protein [Aphanothece hegewaldii CCALA 016]|uniref:Spermidine/putrescine import ATP-binding protein PotA n=1 Tax=Aphanothece hegewaldii CCALA 016 TaxID=2107694 RepID=A0A2T1LSE9_9CHRO|nr:ABC transporter ATP-binding protein [Aphanothece hegewaldii]PSF32262.1 spermidine/putrescine ABC transporter ATP-binding protein [Aphanothece hegewaldii CCALA 016]
MYAVELVNISKSFKSSQNKDFVAVKNLNLSITEGEFFSLLGPSGCGKTTTLRMIAGFELPTSGEVYIQGEPMKQRPPFHRPVNTVFQSYALFPHLNVADNIAFGLEMEKISRSEIRTRVSNALLMVQLEGLENRYPRQLSGGQQQRVALARALVKKPKVLLLDEPLGALDLKLRKEMQLELKHMQQKLGITFIYVTHDQEEALTMSDRIGVMYQGKLLQVGTSREIYEEPQSRFVADFIGESNLLMGRVIEQIGDRGIVLVDEMLLFNIISKNPLPVGEFVTLVIRPEKAVLYLATSDIQGYSGVIEEAVYLGTDTRYLVRLSEQNLITIRQQNLSNHNENNYKPKQSVKVKIIPESIRIIQD